MKSDQVDRIAYYELYAFRIFISLFTFLWLVKLTAMPPWVCLLGGIFLNVPLVVRPFVKSGKLWFVSGFRVRSVPVSDVLLAARKSSFFANWSGRVCTALIWDSKSHRRYTVTSFCRPSMEELVVDCLVPLRHKLGTQEGTLYLKARRDHKLDISAITEMSSLIPGQQLAGTLYDLGGVHPIPMFAVKRCEAVEGTDLFSLKVSGPEFPERIRMGSVARISLGERSSD